MFEVRGDLVRTNRISSSLQEIAAITGLNEGTVRSHISLARGKLKEKLADLHGGSND